MAALSSIGRGTVVRGNIRGDGDLDIHGRVEGSVVLGGDLVIAETGVVRSDVTARRVTVRGAVLGNISATEALVLEAGARVVGDLGAPQVGIRPGALLRGNVSTEGPLKAGSTSAGASSAASRGRTAAPAAAARPAPAPARAPARPAAAPAASRAAAPAPSASRSGGASASAPAATRAAPAAQPAAQPSAAAPAPAAPAAAATAAEAPAAPAPAATPAAKPAAAASASSSGAAAAGPPPPVVPSIGKGARGSIRRGKGGR